MHRRSGDKLGNAIRENALMTAQGMIARSFPVEEVIAMITDGAIKDSATVASFGLLRLKGLL